MNENEKTFVCEQCGRRFGKEHGLKVHIARSHGSGKTGKADAQARRRRARMADVQINEEPLSAELVSRVVEQLSNGYDEAQEIIRACVDGLKTLTARNHELRKDLIKSRHELQQALKLTAETTD